MIIDRRESIPTILQHAMKLGKESVHELMNEILSFHKRPANDRKV